MGIRLRTDEVTLLLQILDDIFPAGIAVLSLIDTAIFIDDRTSVHNLDDFKMMASGNGKVVGIAGRRDFHGTGTEIHGDIIIGDDRNSFVNDRQDDLFAYLVDITGVIGIDRNSRIPQHRFGARCGNDNVTTSVDKGITDIPEKARFFLVFHFKVRDRRMTAGTPVYDVVPLVNQTIMI